MADAVGGMAGKAALGMFGPHPSITIVTFWQGIVEIVIRAVTVVRPSFIELCCTPVRWLHAWLVLQMQTH